MDLIKLFTQIRNDMRTSPLKMIRDRNADIPFFNVVAEDLSNVERDADTLLSKFKAPLKVVIMGEVKSGKSTLLNALAGGMVSPVNVTETTATIIEAFYSDENKGVILKADGTKISGTLEEIFEILDKHRNDQEFYKDCVCVQFGLPFSRLKQFYIVDTPGLATITAQNAERTRNYVQNADVILWVLNGNHLGQADVEDAVAEFAKYGKPMLGIINRIDEVSTNPIRLVNYTRQRLGAYFDEIFAISAYEAFDGIVNNDKGKLENSGFYELFEYLVDNIESKPDKVQEKSLILSMQALLKRDLYLHESYSRNIAFCLDKVKSHKEKLEYQATKLEKQIEKRLRLWLNQEFLKEELDILNEQSAKMTVFSGKKEIQDLAEKCFSAENIERQIKYIVGEINKEYTKEWQAFAETILKEINEEIEQFAENEESRYRNEYLSSISQDQNFLMQGIKRGALIAGAYGTAIALYEALLGSYAAYISVGSSLSAVLPPALIAGAAVGAVVSVITFKKQKDAYKENIRKAIAEVKSNIEKEVLPNILGTIQEKNEEIVTRLQSEFERALCNSWSEDMLNKLDSAIKSYCIKINKYLSKFEQILVDYV